MKNNRYSNQQQFNRNNHSKSALTLNPFKLLFRVLNRALDWYKQNILAPMNEFFAGCEIKPMFERNVEAFDRAVKEKHQREGTTYYSNCNAPRGTFSEDPVMDSILKAQVYHQTHHRHHSHHNTHW